MKFRMKPVVIEAVQFTGKNIGEIETFCGGVVRRVTLGDGRAWFVIATIETMRADIGDWIIKGIMGEFYPCKPDIFEATYEAVT